MAWSSLAGGSRLVSLALRKHLCRNVAPQLRQRRSFATGQGGGPLKNATLENFDLKKIQNAIKTVQNGAKTIVNLDSDFKIMLSVVPVVILTSYYFWTKNESQSNKRIAHHTIMLPQPAAISNNSVGMIPAINQSAVPPVVTEEVPCCACAESPAIVDEATIEPEDAPYKEENNFTLLLTKNKEIGGDITNILDCKPRTATNEGDAELLIPMEIANASPTIEPEVPASVAPPPVDPLPEAAATDSPCVDPSEMASSEGSNPLEGRARRRRKRSRSNKDKDAEGDE